MTPSKSTAIVISAALVAGVVYLVPVVDEVPDHAGNAAQLVAVDRDAQDRSEASARVGCDEGGVTSRAEVDVGGTYLLERPPVPEHLQHRPAPEPRARHRALSPFVAA